MGSDKSDVSPRGNTLLGEVDAEPLQFHCIPDGLWKFNKPLSVRMVLNSESGIIYVSKTVFQRLEVHFLGEELAYPFPGEYSVAVADGKSL